MMDITPESVREMLEAATPGPWRAGADWIAHGDPSEFELLAQLTGDADYTGHDADMMAAAPDLARAYLAEHERADRLQRLLDGSQATVVQISAYPATLIQERDALQEVIDAIIDAIGAVCVEYGYGHEQDFGPTEPPRAAEMAQAVRSMVKALFADHIDLDHAVCELTALGVPLLGQVVVRTYDCGTDCSILNGGESIGCPGLHEEHGEGPLDAMERIRMLGDQRDEARAGRDRLRRILAVEQGDVSQAPKGWSFHPGKCWWQHGASVWVWPTTRRTWGWRTKPEDPPQFCATALEAMEAADKARGVNDDG